MNVAGPNRQPRRPEIDLKHSYYYASLFPVGPDAIGADALLVRVATYYHDIGKREKVELEY